MEVLGQHSSAITVKRGSLHVVYFDWIILFTWTRQDRAVNPLDSGPLIAPAIVRPRGQLPVQGYTINDFCNHTDSHLLLSLQLTLLSAVQLAIDSGLLTC